MEGERGVSKEEDGARAESVRTVPFKLQKLSETMYTDDKEEALTKFRQLLDYLPPQMISDTSVDDNGSVFQDAVLGLHPNNPSAAHDFIILLLEHGVDPMVGTDTVKDSPMQLAADRNGNLYNMILTWTWNQRKEPDTEVKELVSSLPVKLAIGEEIPDEVKLQQLSKAMYQDDQEKAKNKFCELLSSLSPELVRSLFFKS